MASKDQNRIQRNIQNSSGHNSYHCKRCTPLKTKLIIDYKRRHHKRRTDQNDPKIAHCIWKNRFRGSEKYRQRTQENQSQRTKYKPHNKCRKKSRRCHFLSILKILFAQFSGNIVARSVSKEKPTRLNNCHHRKDNTDRCRRLRIDPSHKHRVYHIVK